MKKGHKHTGKIDAHHTPAHPGKDQHASAEFHKANAAHGMPMGCCEDGECSGQGGQEKYGGEGMAGNCSYS